MQIKKSEAIFAAVNFLCVKLFITAPQCFVDIGKNAAWISVCINAAAAFGAFLLIYFLYVKSGKRDMLSVMPRWMKGFAGMLTALYFVVTAGISTAILIRGVIRTFMPETPAFLLLAAVGAVVIYASSKGVKANIQLSMVITPLILLLVIVSAALIPHMEPSNLFPILGDGNFYLASAFGFNFFSDFIVFYLMVPYMKEKKDVLGAGCITLSVTAALALIAVVTDTLTIPYGARFVSPFYQMMTFMAGSNSVISLIKIFKLIFLLNFFLYLSSAMAFAAHTLEKSLSLKYPEKTVWFLTLCTLTVAEIQYGNLTLPEVYSAVFSAGFVIFPLIPLCAYIFRRRKNL